MCVFLLTFLLSHLDFSLNYSVDVLSTIKIHHVHADLKCPVETCVNWIVKQHSWRCFCTSHTEVGTLLLSYVFLNKHLPRGGHGATEPFSPHLCLGNRPLVHFLLHQVPGYSKNQGELYDVFSGSPTPIRKRSGWIFNTVKAEEKAGKITSPILRKFILLICLGRAQLGCALCSFQWV